MKKIELSNGKTVEMREPKVKDVKKLYGEALLRGGSYGCV